MTTSARSQAEEATLAFWRERDIMHRSFVRPAPRGSYVFFEGPPTANGKPGIHHVCARAIKDLYPRFRAMQGFRVVRRAGWDTHGLPVEVEIEKKIGSKGKQDIEAYGIAEFNRLCRESVFEYIGDWNKLTERIGFWIDLDDAYVTYTNSYIETCWWLLKDLWTRGFLFEAYKTTRHCPRCNTSLADHEVSLGMREDVDDPSVWPKFHANLSALYERGIVDDASIPVSFLAWTTTPWTLPANVALAVKPGAVYALVEEGGERYIVAEALVAATFGEVPHQIVKTFPAEAVAGIRYEPVGSGRPDEGADLTSIHRVITDDFVDLGDGTGIVHIAPAYGDLDIGNRHDLPTVFSVDLAGEVYSGVTVKGMTGDLSGTFFKNADAQITKALTRAGLMYRSGRIIHAYPFCWRDDTPLLFMAKNSWYIRTTAVRDKLLRSNETIGWTPQHIRNGRFGDWLKNNVDWALSRERYWGCPLPIWESDDGRKICVGSVTELSDLAGRDLSGLDLHRPYVDEIAFEHDGATWRRVPYTIDVWFESGAMPYAQWHYPFENHEKFFTNFPADFISEALDQTRGWFYTLHALATLLTDTGTDSRPPGPLADRFPDSPAFKNCVVLGLLTDADGKKMSKRWGNIVEPWTILNEQGADALRWYLYESGPGDPTKPFIVGDVTEALRKFVMTLLNTVRFYVMYDETEKPDLSGTIPVDQRPEIDRWLMAALHRLIGEVTAAMESFDSTTAARRIQTFVIDHLSNWYVRINRRRFWGSAEEKDAAFQTLRAALGTVSKLIAPMTPFLAEEVHRSLRATENEAESVHLTDWPIGDTALVDARLLAEMELVLRVVELGRAARAQAKIRTRQPLPELIVRAGSAAENEALERHADLILGELNVKKMTMLDVNTRFVTYALRPNLPVVGKILGRDTPHLQAVLAAADTYAIVDNIHHGRATELEVRGNTISLGANAFLVTVNSPAGYAAVENKGLMVALNTELNNELVAEGRVREIVRAVQDARKKAGYEITDRIHLVISCDEDLTAAVTRHRDYVCDEALVNDLSFCDVIASDGPVDLEIDGRPLKLSLRRVTDV